jgi:hypothetical protein
MPDSVGNKATVTIVRVGEYDHVVDLDAQGLPLFAGSGCPSLQELTVRTWLSGNCVGGILV